MTENERRQKFNRAVFLTKIVLHTSGSFYAGQSEFCLLHNLGRWSGKLRGYCISIDSIRTLGLKSNLILTIRKNSI